MCQEHGFAEMLPHCPHPGLKTWRAAGGMGMEGPLGLRTEVPAGVLSATVSRRHRSSPLFLHSLRSGSDVQDYALTGYVWSAVTPSPEHLGDEVNLKVTVLCDSLREPLTFTCNCKLGGGCVGILRGGAGVTVLKPQTASLAGAGPAGRGGSG